MPGDSLEVLFLAAVFLPSCVLQFLETEFCTGLEIRNAGYGVCDLIPHMVVSVLSENPLYHSLKIVDWLKRRPEVYFIIIWQLAYSV